MKKLAHTPPRSWILLLLFDSISKAGVDFLIHDGTGTVRVPLRMIPQQQILAWCENKEEYTTILCIDLYYLLQISNRCERDARLESSVWNDPPPHAENFLHRHGYSSRGWFFNKRLRYSEGKMKPGDWIAIMADFQPDPMSPPGENWLVACVPSVPTDNGIPKILMSNLMECFGAVQQMPGYAPPTASAAPIGSSPAVQPFADTGVVNPSYPNNVQIAMNMNPSAPPPPPLPLQTYTYGGTEEGQDARKHLLRGYPDSIYNAST